MSNNKQTPVTPHPVRTASIPYIVFKVLTGRACGACIRYIWIVITKFFLPQFVAKMRPGKTPVVQVDHALDMKIPFDPSMVNIYLGFIQIWVRGISLIRRELGRKCNPDLAAFFDGLSDCYLDAYEVYRVYLSTTERPPKAANRHFRMIYAFDPHLNCVPSLHIMIVCYAFLQVTRLYAKYGLVEKNQSTIDDLYQQALDISETVIYVKQHSVNCISAALYMISTLRPEFGSKDAHVFIYKLFRERLPLADQIEIRAYITELYDRFRSDSRSGGPEFTGVLIDFLANYHESPVENVSARA